MIDAIECPVCKENSKKVIVFDKVDIFKCESCSHMFSKNVQLKPEEIYCADYFKSSHENFFNHPDVDLYDSVVNYIEKEKNMNISIVDLGCGTGNFLNYLKSRGFNNLTGVDLIENKDTSIEYMQSNILEYNPTKKFDVIVSNMNIEHIEDLDSYISKIDSLLSEDGVVILNTINEHSLIYTISKILNSLNIKFVAQRLYEPHHVNHFSINSLELLLKRFNYKVINKKIKNYPLKSIDVPKGFFGFIQKCLVSVIFAFSSFSNLGISQTQYFKKK
jgi:2-polyprenyl-3-methyl-5-hydroxy-6-metoxy-1,4-benzoquinol methylase